MISKNLSHFNIPSPKIREYQSCEILKIYFGNNDKVIKSLPIKYKLSFSQNLPPKFKFVQLPIWAHDCGVEGKMLVPSEFFEEWQKVAWLDIVWWMATGYPEKLWEIKNGSIDSYSFRLKGWDSIYWKYAWVNRIGMFLRKWASQKLRKKETILFGPLPKASLVFTHDVDAIKKTNIIILKQVCFNLLNLLKLSFKFDFRGVHNKLKNIYNFIFSKDNYFYIFKILEIEKIYGIKSIFLFYCKDNKENRPFSSVLIDPSYNINNPLFNRIFKEINNSKSKIGLHPSAINYLDSDKIKKQKEILEFRYSRKVEIIRQHWLRFSWLRTWNAQRKSGFKLDLTLGFNDISSFRNATALKAPLFLRNNRISFEYIPMVIMDSHLYDYNHFNDETRLNHLKHFINEIKFVGGTGSVIWHTHVFGKDYNWGKSYIDLIKIWKKI